MNTIYLKELENVDELFNKNSKMPKIVKAILCFLKKIFCILTVKENGLCILPYKNLNKFVIIKLTVKCISKISNNIVLSKKIGKNMKLKEELKQNEIHIYNGKKLFNYMLLDCLKYISKNMNEKIQKQEISILLNNITELDKNNIIYLSKNLKRVNIVTNNINRFKKLENYLQEELGISITLSNNKKKSLLKSKIILNLDFNENEINLYSINRKAIIINVNDRINIKSKMFEGINISNYEIIYKNLNEYNKFEKKEIYESKINELNNYNSIIDKIKKDKVKIINLMGQNGVIDKKEYIRINKIA